MKNVKIQQGFIGIDLFAGAGGLSLGARNAGIEVVAAVEKDLYASQTYLKNHPNTKVYNDDIRNVKIAKEDFLLDGNIVILFGGPPCQGFSVSNKRTRNKFNSSNWLFNEFIRISKEIQPDWIVFENVYGFINTENHLFSNTLIAEIEEIGYSVVCYILNADEFGVPQKRKRFFLIASKHGHYVKKPKKVESIVTVKDAIFDLPVLSNGANIDVLGYRCDAQSNYAKLLRGDLEQCTGHLVSKNAAYVIERYRYIPQGGNWRSIPNCLMQNYKDKSRCHEGIYRRLDETEPAWTIGNYRKAMLVHPWEDRGISVREAARIQSFPDNYVFMGPLGFQQQQVANAVPPLLAETIFKMIVNGVYRR